MKKTDRQRLTAFILTGTLVTLIAVAVAGADFIFVAVQLAVVLIAVGIVIRLFPGGRFFVLSLVNFIGVYACLYIFFLETNFATGSEIAAHPGFALPVVGFLAGVWCRRTRIRRIIESPVLRQEQHFERTLFWLLPIAEVGVWTFFVPGLELGPRGVDIALVTSMAVIAVLVFVVSGAVATFLIDMGLLFDEFFERARGLVIPAIAFLTFYSLIVILFAATYRVIDRFTAAAQFQVNGVAQEITFSDSLYFSIVTLSTVGYGDIEPATGLVRVIVAVQIVAGVLLLLFGFHELLTYTRERRGRRHTSE